MMVLTNRRTRYSLVKGVGSFQRIAHGLVEDVGSPRNSS